MTVIVGVDPGLSGAIALLGSDGNLLDAIDTPHADGMVLGATLADTLDGWRATHGISAAWVERAQAMPGQGGSSTFKYGAAWALVLGVIVGQRIPVHHVSPAKWKKAAGLSQDKTASRRRATELWPTFAAEFARVKDDGRAEAALIARHGWLELTRSAA